VLLVTELFPPAVGGTPTLFEALYSRLQDLKVVVLTNVTHDQSSVSARADDMTVVRRPIATTRWGILNGKALAHHLRVVGLTRTLGSRREVIVHCGRALPEGVAAWISRLTGGPEYICWAHGEDIASARRSRELTWLMTRVYTGAATNIANSHHTRRMLEGLGIRSDRIHVVHPGVDVDRFRPRNDGVEIRRRFAGGGQTILLSIGRLQRRKGHDLAIDAVSRLGASVPVHYLIGGDGDERDRLEALVAARGVGDRVTFLGELQPDDLPRYYAACDIFLMPNRIDEDGDVEGFGMVFLEAAASGKPAIGGRSGGVVEAVVDGETGLLVSGTDPEELAAAIRDLTQSVAKRCAMGAAAHERARRAFTWERAAAEVRAVHMKVESFERLLSSQ